MRLKSPKRHGMSATKPSPLPNNGGVQEGRQSYHQDAGPGVDGEHRSHISQEGDDEGFSSGAGRGLVR